MTPDAVPTIPPMARHSSLPPLTPADTDAAYASAQCVVETHRRLAGWLKQGQTLAQIDTFVARSLEDLKCRSCFLHYKLPRVPPFPSHACLSVNDCVVHGTAGSYTEPMKAGDVLTIDVGVVHKGWIGDAAWTYVYGTPSPLVKRLTGCGKAALARGIRELRPGNTYLQWAQAVQGYVEGPPPLGCGFRLIRGYGGHGYGRELHAPPYVSNVTAHPGEWADASKPCEPGTLVAVEPMIAVSTGQTVQRGRAWPVYTADGSLSVHYEHDVLITASGPRVLTEGLDELPDVIW